MQTTALVLLRHAADQRTMRLGNDSRRISKITASGPTVPKALAWSTKTAAVRCCEALRCMAALICSNWSGVELPGKKPDGCRVNWDSMTSRMRVAEMRSMSLLGQLLIVTGRWGSRLDAVLSGLGRSSTAPRRRFRGTAPARRRISNSQGAARLATRPRWRSASPCIPSGPGAGPKSNSRRVRPGSAILIG
ncbi:hypothetical protein C3747_49g8 [Trypanosoma cruzi]|uniref:Uncharacterized protein n=1 Tax=Trypanosoma cruzi TaxID=5693 RepID=A0A2V2WVZ6_TRYCR|nr:hypothetical protein C3747_49g8 [Trypanosoma cruzi]